MKYAIRVSPGAKQDIITVIGDNSLKVATTAPAQQGKANAAVLKQLAKHFQVKHSQAFLVAGKTSKDKIFEVLG